MIFSPKNEGMDVDNITRRKFIWIYQFEVFLLACIVWTYLFAIECVHSYIIHALHS